MREIERGWGERERVREVGMRRDRRSEIDR